jgi:hypothetical protein
MNESQKAFSDLAVRIFLSQLRLSMLIRGLTVHEFISIEEENGGHMRVFDAAIVVGLLLVRVLIRGFEALERGRRVCC